jgi:hypothetical protein
MFLLFAGTSHWSYIGFLRQHLVDAKDVIGVFGVNKMLTQKMLYEFLASTKC